MHVLDASAFIHEYETDEPIASIPAVGEELTGSHAYRFQAKAGGGMRIHVPSGDALDRVRSAARVTGDDGELSETDRRLLAAAVELDGVVVTDDYAVQNVASQLGVAVEAIARGEIDEHREWGFQCQGCGREFDDDPGRCPVCGSDCTRKNPS